jgi:hypothetical protein
MGYGDGSWPTSPPPSGLRPSTSSSSARPMNLARLADLGHPVRQATYSLREVGSPTLAEVLAPYVDRWTEAARNEGPPTSR